MRIAIVGAGPAGLFLARLIKRARPETDIRVYEQNPRGATYGFGVVVADRGLHRLQAADPATAEAIAAASFVSRHRLISHNAETIFVEGGGYGGAIGRQRLLDILQQACDEVDVPVSYECRIEDLETLDADLVVGADGANSVVRAHREAGFDPTVRTLSAKLAWYGVAQHFPYPLLAFKSWRGGRFWGVGYAYTERMGTFVAECDAATWTGCGLDRMTDDERTKVAEEVFKDELGGHPLISNRSLWGSLRLIRCRNWYSGRYVLLGDALHSAHPSIGSGTRIAMEDAIILAQELTTQADIATALQRFQTIRAPAKRKLVQAMDRSVEWYESIGSRLSSLTPLDLVFDFMMRTGRIDEARLRSEFPEFMAAHNDSWRAFVANSDAGAALAAPM